MTEREMYEALVRSNRYSTYGCFPSTQYNNRKDLDTMDFNKTSIVVDGYTFPTYGIELDSDYSGTRITASAYLSSDMNFAIKCAKSTKPLTIVNVIFNPPATIVFWNDKTKTIVKADYTYEEFDPEKGLAMAIAKKMLGDNKGRYYDIFKHWRKKWDEQNEVNVEIELDLNDPIKNLADGLKKFNNTFKDICKDDNCRALEDFN